MVRKRCLKSNTFHYGGNDYVKAVNVLNKICGCHKVLGLLIRQICALQGSKMC